MAGLVVLTVIAMALSTVPQMAQAQNTGSVYTSKKAILMAGTAEVQVVDCRAYWTWDLTRKTITVKECERDAVTFTFLKYDPEALDESDWNKTCQRFYVHSSDKRMIVDVYLIQRRVNVDMQDREGHLLAVQRYYNQ